jgi:hypothetical protein
VTGIAVNGGFQINAFAAAVEKGKITQVPLTAAH